MNLCIDQGNSRTKVALFKDGVIVKNLLYRSFTSVDVERLFSLYPITQSIVSSVANMEPAVINALNRLSKRFVLFDHFKLFSKSICNMLANCFYITTK